MAVKWNDEYNPNEIAKKLESIKVIEDDGKISFHALPHTEYIAVLESMLTFTSKIPDWDKSRIVNSSVSKVAQKGAITAQNLLSEIQKAIGQFEAFPRQSYDLVSSISIINKGKSLSRFYLSGSPIILEPKLNNKHKSGRKHLQELTKLNTDSQPPKDYMPVKIRVHGRSVYEAFDLGINTLDLFRGIWNLAYNRNQYMRISWGKGEPINKIRTGLIHSLHLPDGSLATEAGWYDSSYQETKVVDITPHVQAFGRFFKSTVAKLKKSHYREDLENLIILYTRALDLTDWNSSFLWLWSILEKLTGTEGAYAITIRRASFVFEDREYYQQVLRHLKDFRNKFVHDAFNSDEIETYMYQIKVCTEALLRFHLGNSFGFKSIKQATEFLDLPSERLILDYQIRLRKYALNFIGASKRKKK